MPVSAPLCRVKWVIIPGIVSIESIVSIVSGVLLVVGSVNSEYCPRVGVMTWSAHNEVSTSPPRHHTPLFPFVTRISSPLSGPARPPGRDRVFTFYSAMIADALYLLNQLLTGAQTLPPVSYQAITLCSLYLPDKSETWAWDLRLVLWWRRWQQVS